MKPRRSQAGIRGLARGSDERGSLVIAMAVVLVLAGLSIVALARTVAAIGSARVAQDAAAAAAAADAGLTDAVSALDSAPPTPPFPARIGPGYGTIGPGSGAMGPGSGAMGPGSGAMGPASPPAAAATFRWTATATDAGSVAIRSVGTVNGRQHQVNAVASRGPQWPWVLATTGSLLLDGPASVTGRMAAGGPMVLRGGASGGSAQELLGPGAACTGCSAADVLRAPVTFPVAVLPASPPPLPCPANPMNELDEGTYLCQGDIAFGDDVRVTGPVILYQVNGPGPAAIRFSTGEINGAGPASNLIIHKIGPGSVDLGAAAIAGIIDAPEGVFASTSCGFRLRGALLLGSFSCATSGTGPTLAYGAGSPLATAWSIGSRRDAPVGSP